MAFAYRYVVIVLLSIGLAIVYGLKVNLSVTIVSMVNHTALGQGNTSSNGDDDPCGFANDTKGKKSGSEDGPFEWSPNMQGNLLSSYFWGYLIIMLPGSQLAEKTSPKWVYFASIGINTVGTLLMPLACKIHYGVAYAMRVIQGIGGGLSFPANHVFIAHWAPPTERSLMSSIAFSGSVLGTVISNYVSGQTAMYWGWEWVFYSQGGLSILWLIVWAIFAGDRPHKVKLIRKEEVEYIEKSLGDVEDGSPHKHKVPWRKIFKSVPFWAILIAHTFSNFAFYLLLMNMPLYYKRVLRFDMQQTSTYSAIPYFLMWIFSLSLGETLDVLRKKEKITTTFARKLATGIASVPVMVCLLVLSFFSCNKVLSVILLSTSLMCLGGMFCGFLTNHIDIANNFAGSLMGLTNTIATIPGVVGPVFVGVMINNFPALTAWRIVFYVTCVFLLIELIVYSIFGTGNEQSWNRPEENA